MPRINSSISYPTERDGDFKKAKLILATRNMSLSEFIIEQITKLIETNQTNPNASMDNFIGELTGSKTPALMRPSEVWEEYLITLREDPHSWEKFGRQFQMIVEMFNSIERIGRV